MEKKYIFKFVIPVAILSGIFTGPLYNLLTFLNTGILESHWSIYVNNLVFANLMALCFILFAVIFILTMQYVERLTKDPLIILSMGVIGFSCIYASFIWVWDVAVLVFIITSVATGYLIPAIIKFTTEKAQKEYNNLRYALVLPIGTLIWIFISFVIFAVAGLPWRMLFLVSGIITISSSFIIVFI
jgi:MFS family permease